MSTKWIVVPVSLFEIGGKTSMPRIDPVTGREMPGWRVPIDHPPMTPIELDADEADKLLALYAAQGAREVPPS